MTKTDLKINKPRYRGKKKFELFLFPSRLLSPVALFLQQRLESLKKTKRVVEREDPFKDVSRLADNASPDTDAAEQFGHARTSAIKERLEKNIKQTKEALARLNSGEYGVCEDCGKMIDTDRLGIYPEATLCAKCQNKREK